MRHDLSLTDLQLSILDILWERGEATTQEVHARLSRDRELAVTTVATLLTRLERRRILERRKEGRHFLYRSRVTRRDVRRTMVRELTASLFGGDPASLVSHLVDSHEVGPRDLERIRRLIEEAEALPGSSPGREESTSDADVPRS